MSITIIKWMRDRCWLGHDWSKWQQYKQQYSYLVRQNWLGANVEGPREYEAWEDMQKRYCKRCGKQQIEKVD